MEIWKTGQGGPFSSKLMFLTLITNQILVVSALNIYICIYQVASALQACIYWKNCIIDPDWWVYRSMTINCSSNLKKDIMFGFTKSLNSRILVSLLEILLTLISLRPNILSGFLGWLFGLALVFQIGWVSLAAQLWNVVGKFPIWSHVFCFFLVCHAKVFRTTFHKPAHTCGQFGYTSPLLSSQW